MTTASSVWNINMAAISWVWKTNMAAISLFRNTNMAAMISCKNTLLGMLIFTPYILKTTWYAEKSTLGLFHTFIYLGSSEIMVAFHCFRTQIWSCDVMRKHSIGYANFYPLHLANYLVCRKDHNMN